MISSENNSQLETKSKKNFYDLINKYYLNLENIFKVPIKFWFETFEEKQ
jgi:hypothetical protein